MLKLSVILCACLFWQQAEAQVAPPENLRNQTLPASNFHSISSTSGQFVIQDNRSPGTSPFPLEKGMERNFIRLDNRYLAVSCERVKTALQKELGAPNQWVGKIYITLHEARSLDETIVIGSVISAGKWTYYVSMPDTVERNRLMSALVGVILLEMANRNADRSAEIPMWLTQGLARELTASSRMGLLVAAPTEGNAQILMSSQLYDGTNAAPLELAHEELQMRPPLTLDQLTWPPPDLVENETYRSSAQLLVDQLLSLPNGRDNMRAFVGKLPLYLNWQMAFLDAFHSRFGSQLDIEKWWALCLLNFTGRDLAHVLPFDESWRKLNDILTTGVDVRTGMDELPLQTRFSLQRIIAEWSFATQQQVLRNKLQQLATFRNWASQELVGTVDDYRQVLQVYLRGRERTGFFRATVVQRVFGSDQGAKETIEQLDFLDARREMMRRAPEPNPQVTANAPINR